MPIKKCPICGSRLHKIIVGMPTEDDSLNPKDWVIFAGCIIDEITPKRLCLSCDESASWQIDSEDQ